MKRITLTGRLKAVANYIKQDGAVADVGTDHGYIPVYLAQNLLARKIIASDVKKGPLARAVASAEEYGVSERIEFVQTNGLDGLEGQGIDTVVIAGMGGETIAGILQKAPWIRTEYVRLILQPQSKTEELVSWLGHHGFEIKDASLVLDEGRIYVVLLAWAGEKSEGCDFLRILAEKCEALLPQYLEHQIEKTRRALAGLQQSSGGDHSALEAKSRELEAFEHMKEETDRWHA